MVWESSEKSTDWYIVICTSEFLISIEATLDNISELDLSCNESSIIFSETYLLIHLSQIGNELKCTKSQMKKLHHFNIAGHHLQNTIAWITIRKFRQFHKFLE